MSTTRLAFPVLWLAISAAVGCGRPLGAWFPGAPEPGPDAAICPGPPEVQCARREQGGCTRWIDVAPECAPTREWRCPADAIAREPDDSGTDLCLPLYGEESPFYWLASAGIPMERGDGQCMWIMSEGVTFGDRVVSHPAALMPLEPSAGNCLAGASILGDEEPVSVADESELGDDDIASLGDGFRWGGRTWFYYRHWVWDETQVFGVRLLGTRLAWYDHAQEAVRFLPGFLWDAELAFGDAAVVVDGVPHVYGCHGPPVFLSYECHVARYIGGELGDPAGYEYFAGNGEWSGDISREVPVFESGPHRTAVRYLAAWDQYVMLFVHGFGMQIELRVSVKPEGPWSEPVVVGECELPGEDPDAFCATPALHLELMADWRPDELVITYDIGTLAEDWEARRHDSPAAYWPRLARLPVP